VNLTGLDIETTGTDINAGHRLIQIGIVLPDGGKIVHDVQPTGDITISGEAMKVNGISLARLGAAKKTHVVDETIAADLKGRGFAAQSLTPVGWNVGGFDMSFIKAELPRTAVYFSYRTLDLTGLAMLYELRTGKGYRELKDLFATRTKEILGRDERHDALFDAEAALVALDLFKEMEWK
jgi:DNA polymerase III epsilon subunit-like protein